jgi:hypothetical protein
MQTTPISTTESRAIPVHATAMNTYQATRRISPSLVRPAYR